MTLPIVNALTDLGQLRGAAGSHRFLADDQNDYIVKFVNGQNKIAINEIVAGLIAKKLGLPTPDKVLVNVTRDVIEDSGALNEGLLQTNPHIGSSVLPKEGEDFDKFSDEKLASMKLTNAESVYGIVAFDNWVLNNDRNNRGNNMIIFLPRNKIHLVMIDFSHCFGSENWSSASLTAIMNDKNAVPVFPYIAGLLTEKAKFASWLDKIETFEDSQITEILDSIPASWSFPEGEKAILLDFLKTRRDMVRKIISNNWR
ncbi:MAG: HipA family kinase [Nitrososphaera sp.]|jgi:hypothetical protein